MIAALHPKWDRIAERSERQIGPWPHRHDDFAGRERSLFRGEAPAPVAGLLQRARVTAEEASTLAAEQRGIGLRKSAWIGDETRRRKMDGAGKDAGKIWLALRDCLL